MGFESAGLAVIWLLLLSCSSMGGGEAFEQEEKQTISVGGKVVCQDCTKGWSEWVQGAKPLKGCKVSMTCLDERKRVVYYMSDETDEEGEFLMSVAREGTRLIKKEGCLVRLVSSSDPLCNIFTDFGGGRSGVILDQPSSVYRDVVKYTVGPFYFTSPLCDEPDTTTPLSDSGGNY